MKAQRHQPTLAELEARLRAAKYERREHDADCKLWDYESNNGCPDCERTQAAVRAARARWKAARDR